MKKLIGIIAIVTVLISSIHSNRVEAEELTVSSYKDISGHWAEKTILKANEVNLVKGYEDGTFRPNNSVTRGEFAAFLGRATTQTVTNVLDVPFTDVKGHWSEPDIQKDFSLGFIQAGDYPNGFAPDTPMTRREIAKWMSNGLSSRSEDYKQALLDMKGTYLPVKEEFTNTLATNDIPYVGLMMGTGLLTGFPDLSFGLDKNTTRAEVATILLRYVDVESKQATDFLGLRELREVGTGGTNLTTITPYTYGQMLYAPEKKLAFKNIQDKKITLTRNGSGSMEIHHMIVVDPKTADDYTGIYGKMFMGKDSFVPDGYYLVFTDITITPAIDKFGSTIFNQGTATFLTQGDRIRSEDFAKTGLTTVPSREEGTLFKKDVPVRLWVYHTLLRKNIVDDVTTDDGSRVIYIYYPDGIQ